MGGNYTIVLFLAVFALLVLIVSIFLARFKIKNTIDEEINEIGDTFTLTQSTSKYAYTVTGYIQSVNNNGLIAEITDEGYANISDIPLYSRVCNEPNASLLALGDCARVKYPAPWGELAKEKCHAP